MHYVMAEETFTCPAEALATLLGKKWVPQLLEQLATGGKRFGELHRALPGSTPKMLKQQLQLLMTNDLVLNSKQTIGNSLRSSYCLTSKGLSLIPLVQQLKTWGQRELVCEA